VVAAWAAYSSFAAQVPDPQTVAAMEPPLDSHVYAADGTLIATFHEQDFSHEHVALNSDPCSSQYSSNNHGNVSYWLVKATVDVEDRHFCTEGSSDIARLAKAAFTDITHSGSLQGASTITEQLAKISLPASEQTSSSLSRKIKQTILGQELDNDFTKDQIMEMYLNRVFYGNHSVGIETASQLFFNIPSKDLDLAQAAMLAGLPQSPSVYDPLVHDSTVSVNPYAKDRQKVVLDAMVSSGDITQTQENQAYAENLTYHSWTEADQNKAPSFVDYLQSYLTTHFGDQYINPGGWEIHTTLDLHLQQLADQNVAAQVQLNAGPHNMHDGALVAIDPTNGAVKAMTGGWNYSDPVEGDVNMATNPRDPGSSIKIFTYTAAIASHQFTMTTPIVDAPFTFPGGYSPLDYDRHWHGTCSLPHCLGNSFNMPAVKVEYATGIPYITNLEIAAGLTVLTDPADRPAPTQWAATLGSFAYGIPPIEMADGAATIADMGVHHDPAPITTIVDANSGLTIYAYDATKAAVRVVPADVAFIMNEILSNDSNRQPEFPAHGDLTLGTRRAAAKTGTTDFYTDNWTVGWTPQLVSAVWVGNPTPSCLNPQDTGLLQQRMSQRSALYSGETVTDPFSASDLAHYGLTPINADCGHLDNSTGITGAAPIWHGFMTAALQNVQASWYTKPADVIGPSNNDNGTFSLPGASGNSSFSVNGVPTTGCWYYGPTPDPTSQCTFLGGSGTPPTTSPSP